VILGLDSKAGGPDLAKEAAEKIKAPDRRFPAIMPLTCTNLDAERRSYA
jgi:hypothetical protein